MLPHHPLLALLTLDLITHGILLYCRLSTTNNHEFHPFSHLAFVIDDLLLITPIRIVFIFLVVAIRARYAFKTLWPSRRELRKAFLPVKVIVFMSWALPSSYALVKGLARVVEHSDHTNNQQNDDNDDKENDLPPLSVFVCTVLGTGILAVVEGYASRRAMRIWYDEAQKARMVMRRRRRALTKITSTGSSRSLLQLQQQGGGGGGGSSSLLLVPTSSPNTSNTSPLLSRTNTSSLLLTVSMPASESPKTFLANVPPKFLPREKSSSTVGTEDNEQEEEPLIDNDISNNNNVTTATGNGATGNATTTTAIPVETSTTEQPPAAAAVTTTTTTTTPSTNEISDHESDDDSSSDDEAFVVTSPNNQEEEDTSVVLVPDDLHRRISSQQDEAIHRASESGKLKSVKMRVSERGRRVRERRRQTKEEKDQKLPTGASIRELLRFAAPDVPLLAWAFFCLVIAAVAGAFVPRFTGQVINHVSGSDPDREAFKSSVLKLTLAAIVSGIFAGLRGATFTVAMARMNVRLRRALYKALLNQDQGFFDSTKIGELTSRLNNSTTTVSDQIALNINVFLRSMVEGAIVLVLMFRLSWRLSFLSFAAIPLMTLISAVYGEFYRKLSNQANDALADTSGVAEEALGSISTVRDFGARRAERKVYAEELSFFYKLNLKEAFAYSGFAFTWTGIPALITALTLWEGGKLVLDREPGTACGENGSLCSGDLVSFMLYSQSLSNSIDSVGGIFTGIAGALGAADKIFDLLRRQPKVAVLGDTEQDDADDMQLIVGNNQIVPVTSQLVMDQQQGGSIELQNVTFRYPSRKSIIVLKDFSVRVDSGRTVALVGASGSGKSSVIKLVLHHYEPEKGKVSICGRPVNEYVQRDLRRLMSVVGQEPTIFGRSVLRNIVYGLEGEPDEPSFEQVVEAAKLANAHDFIMKLPKGYATLLGERSSSTISGGQKQRICIARALVRKPRILLLDESTSALDAESEHMVMESLDRIMKSGKLAVLVVAHRLSTIKDADNIVVLQDGKVVEQGKHDQLLEKGGKYSELVKRQLQTLATTTSEDVVTSTVVGGGQDKKGG
jgi:ATP-binding cassette subfamily B (MDR/TAP) protein 9